MKNYLFYGAMIFLAFLSACSDDDDGLVAFSVSFSSSAVSMGEDDESTTITLNYSRAATETGMVTVSYEGENAVYGTDFTTDPDGSSGSISIPVAVGDESSTITLTKLQDPIEGTTKSVAFSLSGYDNTAWVNGSLSSANVSFTPIPVVSGVINLETGGSTQPNQCYIDLSTGVQTAVKRDTWEIALYNGSENRVFVNSALLVAAAELPGQTDILSVTEATTFSEPMELQTTDQTFQNVPVTVTTVAELVAGLPVSYTQYGNLDEGIIFTDDASGALANTAFAEISTTEGDNNIHILSLGNEVPTDAAEPGSINTTGDHRGFLKVRVLTDGTSYTIQYAAIDETTSYTEVTIPKDSDKVLTAFSLTTGETVDVEPAAANWDINFSGVFSYYGTSSFGPTTTNTAATYSDFAMHNTLGGTGLYQVLTQDGEGNDTGAPSYTDFAMGDVDEDSFVTDNRSVMRSDWRSISNGIALDDRYYVVKDAAGNYYKLRFTALLSTEGERGYSQFQYERL